MKRGERQKMDREQERAAPINRARFHFDNLYDPQEKANIGPYVVRQIGDLNCEPGLWYPPHTQPVHEISYVVSGTGVFCANGVEYPVKRGSLFVNGADEVHEVRASRDDPFRYMYIGFRASRPIGMEIIEKMDSFYAHPTNRIAHNVFDVQESFIALFNELVVEDQLSGLMKECCVHQLLCQVYRLLNPRSNRNYIVGQGEKNDSEKLVYDIVHYLDNNVGSIDRLTKLSQVFGYSYSYIAKVFSGKMNESLGDYYHRRRFEKAREFLAFGMSVTEVSKLLGYQSIHAFSRAFKQQYGISPRVYMKKDGASK